MSFILDALKKSESDRQRQNGPALYEVRVARPARIGLPPWAVAIVALLGLNLAVIAWLLLHRAGSAPAAAAPPAAAAAPAVPPPAYYGQPVQYPYTYPPPPGVPVQGQPYAYAPPPGAYPPAGYPQQPVQPPQVPAYPAQPPVGGAAANGAISVAGGGAPEDTTTGNPDDYAPAVDPPAVDQGGHVRRGTESGLPLYPEPEAAAAAGLPKLHMDFHAYGGSPQQRFVMINNHTLHEGQSSPDGIRLDEITPDGATISRGPAKYFLPRP